MGLFSEYLSSIKISDLKPIKKAINEAEVDGVQQDQEGEASEDYTATEDTAAEDTQPTEGEANTEEQPAEDNAGTEDQGGDDSTDYTEDIGDMGGDDSMSGDDTGDTSSDTGSDTSTGSDEEAKIDAYYLAREEFPAFSINECSVKMEAITEAQYRDLRVTVNALHKDKA